MTLIADSKQGKPSKAHVPLAKGYEPKACLIKRVLFVGVACNATLIFHTDMSTRTSMKLNTELYTANNSTKVPRTYSAILRAGKVFSPTRLYPMDDGPPTPLAHPSFASSSRPAPPPPLCPCWSLRKQRIQNAAGMEQVVHNDYLHRLKDNRAS